jgi:hypothetical protein
LIVSCWVEVTVRFAKTLGVFDVVHVLNLLRDFDLVDLVRVPYSFIEIVLVMTV